MSDQFKRAKTSAAESDQEPGEVLHSCTNNSVEFFGGEIGNYLHSRVSLEAGIFLIQKNGMPERIGTAQYCSASGFDKFKNRSWECARKPHGVKRFANWPQGWTRIKAGRPCYYLDFGWHFINTRLGSFENFVDIGMVPPCEKVTDLDERIVAMLRFRARHDPSFPSEFRKDFGAFKNNDILGDVIRASPRMPEHKSAVVVKREVAAIQTMIIPGAWIPPPGEGSYIETEPF